MIRRLRDEKRTELDRLHAIRQAERAEWRARRAWRPRPDYGWVIDNDYWGVRYDIWIENNWAPPVYVEVPVYVPTPMPEYPTVPDTTDTTVLWSYEEVGTVALNLEAITRDMYDQIDAVIDSNPNAEYRTRLMGVLADLVDASENYTDAVNAGTDWSDSLDQLFYLDQQMKLARKTLDGYSRESLVKDDEIALNEYVSQLLWTYKVNYSSAQ